MCGDNDNVQFDENCITVNKMKILKHGLLCLTSMITSNLSNQLMHGGTYIMFP